MKKEVLIAVGEDETPGRPKISATMLADAAEMARKLAAAERAGLRILYRPLAGENHQSVPMTIFSSVLRFAGADGATA